VSERRLRPSARALVVAGAAAVLLAVLTGATYTPVFHLRDVRVEGTSVLSRPDVLRTAGLSSSTNVFHLDAGRIDAALEADPWILRADVERHLPGTVVIRITERTPIAAAMRGTQAEGVAADGVVLPGASLQGLPEIRASLGDLSDADRLAAAEALAAMSPILRSRVGAVVALIDGGLRMQLSGGLSVLYGRGGEDGTKAASLRSVLRWAAERHIGVSVVDVSVPGAPSATLADGSTFSP
jgi:cell division protein FtsQ